MTVATTPTSSTNEIASSTTLLRCKRVAGTSTRSHPAQPSPRRLLRSRTFGYLVLLPGRKWSNQLARWLVDEATGFLTPTWEHLITPIRRFRAQLTGPAHLDYAEQGDTAWVYAAWGRGPNPPAAPTTPLTANRCTRPQNPLYPNAIANPQYIYPVLETPPPGGARPTPIPGGPLPDLPVTRPANRSARLCLWPG